jgi:hypothetical protein
MPRVCRFRFSLRQVAILLTLACLTCGMVKAYVEVREQRRVAEHVQEVLEGPNRSLLISYSTVGHRAFELTSYDDQGRLVAELVRVLNEPKSRLPHRDEAIRALRKLSNRPGTLEGMIALLDAQHMKSFQRTIIRELAHVKRGQPLVVERLLELANHPHDSTRYSAYKSLEEIASRHPELEAPIATALIGALQDPFEAIRQRAASALGQLRLRETSLAVTAALDDPSNGVRVGAARSLWKITGDDDALVRVTSEVLLDDDADPEVAQQAIRSLTGIADIPAETIAVLHEHAAAAALVPRAERGSMTYRLGAAAKSVLKANGLDKNSVAMRK